MRTLIASLAAAIAAVVLPAAPATARVHFGDPARIQRQALRDVERRLRLAKPPPDSRALAGAPDGSGLRGPGLTVGSPNFLDRRKVWSVPGTPAAALAWVEAHSPADRPVKLRSSLTSNGVTTTEEIGFEWPPLLGVASERSVLFAAAAADGRTILRADSQAVWIAPHEAAEAIPASARSLEVVHDPNSPQPRSRVVRSPARVRRVAELLDELPVAQPGAFSCPELGEPTGVLVLDFEDAAGTLVAEAKQPLPPGLCQGMQLTIEGKRQDSLVADGGFFRRLRRILG